LFHIGGKHTWPQEDSDTTIHNKSEALGVQVTPQRPDLLKGTLLQIWDHAWEHAKLKENTMKVLMVQYYRHSYIVLGIWDVIQCKINTTKLLFWDVLDSCLTEIQRAVTNWSQCGYTKARQNLSFLILVWALCLSYRVSDSFVHS